MVRTEPVSDDQARTRKCPLCGAEPGDPCVYVATHRQKRYHTSERQRQEAQKIGKPTARVHLERRNAYWQAVKAAQRGPSIVPATREQREIAAAMQQYDMLEYTQLKAWLRENAHILINAGRP